MRLNRERLSILLIVLLVSNALAATRYVDVQNPTPVAPYTNWSTAATVIQDTLDLSENGDVVLVTNGVYAAGGMQVSRADITNRVSVTNTVLVQSVNGPEVTFIEGHRVPPGTSLTNAVRCAFLGSGAVLSGFTLTNGSAGTGNYVNGGAVACMSASAVISNCVLVGNYATGAGGGASRGTLVNCVLRDNHGGGGGAASSAVLINCTLTNNVAGWAAGTLGCTLTNCLLAWNHATNYGGASGYSTLVNCTVVSNSLQAGYGGNGGGSYNDTVFNSILFGNTAPNSANWSGGTIAYSCTTPLPTGPGNFVNPPMFANESTGDFRLQSNSACNNAGQNAYVSTVVDLRSEPRLVGGTVDVGAYEFQGNIRYVSLESTNPIPPYSDWAWAATNIQDGIDAASAGDAVLVTNGLYGNGGRVVYGAMTNRVAVTKPVAVSSVNGAEVTEIRGYRVPGWTNGDSAVRCVYLTNGASLSGFMLSSGATRTNGDYLRETSGGGLWCESTNALVSDCVIQNSFAAYAGGATRSGTLTNCTLAGNGAIAGRMFGGAAWSAVLKDCTLINNNAMRGGGAFESTLENCHLGGNRAQIGGAAADSTLRNSTAMTNSAATGTGGALDHCTVDNCLIVGNDAATGGAVNFCDVTNSVLWDNQATANGGGAYYGWLVNCVVEANLANIGGGAHSANLLNCTVVWNGAATSDGGVYSQGVVQNCIIYYNTAPTAPNGNPGKFDYCCTTPVPAYSPHSFTNEPLFMDRFARDYRLQTDSPCINAGRNSYVSTSSDLAGQPRVVEGTVDIGAYEFQQKPFSLISFAWLQQYGLPTDGSADYQDLDGDGMNNWQEWRSGTMPNDPASWFRLLSITNTGSGTVLTWSTVPDTAYCVERATELSAQAVFSTLATNLWSYTGTRSYNDTSATNGDRYFYRVRLQE